MVTVDFHELKLKPGSLILDAGCGSGRHLRALAKLPNLKIIGIDRNQADLNVALASLKNMSDALSDNYQVACADINKLPFETVFFDCVICSEVLEHIPQHEEALKELVRVLKPQGSLVISVPRYFPERICWFISRAYCNDEGGHVRIYKKKQLQKMINRFGFACWKINYKHALHVPYWWIKCFVGHKNEKNWLVNYYKKFLEWDIMHKTFFVRRLEGFLNPVMGKSIVFYLKKV
jgi:ubiquinone/menaquinone biosynthesis C-methylase UbiE